MPDNYELNSDQLSSVSGGKDDCNITESDFTFKKGETVTTATGTRTIQHRGYFISSTKDRTHLYTVYQLTMTGWYQYTALTNEFLLTSHSVTLYD